MADKLTFLSIDDYINQFSLPLKEKLIELRRVIRVNAPLAKEKIAYQMPTFAYVENLVHFAVQHKHLGFYPTPGAILAFKEELKLYKTSKGAIQFPLTQDFPYELIAQIVRYRVDEVNQNKKK